jgi:phosphoribosyl 1,2-cyclic phosphodiesterase
MYTVDEYRRHRGWGHSHIGHAVDLAVDAGVERLAIFHHNPEHSDAQLDELVNTGRAMAKERGAKLEILAAAEGLTLTV